MQTTPGHMKPGMPPTYTAPLFGWTCFHCGKHFARSAVTAARDHFGPTPNSKASCTFANKTQLVRELRTIEIMLNRLTEKLAEDPAKPRPLGPWTGGITPTQDPNPV